MKEKKELQIFTEEEIQECVNVIAKISKGFELDEKEMKSLEIALMLFDSDVPSDLKGYIEQAKKYYQINQKITKTI